MPEHSPQPSFENLSANGQQQAAGGDHAFSQEVDLLAALAILLAQRRMIVRNVALAAVFFLVLGLVWPPTYTARTTLLPPDKQEQQEWLGLLNNAPFVRLALPPARSTAELFVEVLRSRSVGSGVLHHPILLDSIPTTLAELWQISSEEKALQKLHRRTTVAAGEQGIIEILVEMESPELAAAIARAFVAELDRVNQEKSVSAARNARRYLEAQLEQTSRQMAALADSLTQFQTRYGALGLEQQMQAVMEQAGTLKGNLIAKQVQLELLRRSMTPDNPALAALAAEVAALEKQYQRLQTGTPPQQAEQREYLLPFAQLPAVGRRLAELTRELKVQETVWQLLTQQYHQAKIQEARDTPTVQVLDPAVPPEFRTQPRRLLLWVIGTGVVFVLSVLAAFVRHYVRGLQARQDEWQRWRNLWRAGKAQAPHEQPV
ncbi:MAG: Wzz/FepE/Etk N-terminal domain-containing protein [candidate division KSB1 bacterium]|nr:Wzz/FepE/Etk N-terminal domain-containing protein [candidate division KSB1 bacterium]MDZ7273695.1 Wzz/FepE/Etk N-terminal domain-containing protein [candidate division KSB1 bacterium]MDZ7285851.1 Wzz/FepE/Etk N-terminal domain-containing protein [candidate division KSB1 bacterium]MDZ7298883.1 Wzz/FepE/Etk N-terminal domain-containing protein [candidate division KSB1 bacterium]MDZ7307071.1 Wzz/FepE/Etk N-terminal domain-containing protein [candidate division KSB1 bacterium]